MTRPTLLPVLLLAALVVAQGAEAAADIIDIGKDCKDPALILLEENHWYSYETRLIVHTAAVGSSDQDAQLDIKCPIKVQHSSDCAYTLEFDTCSIKASSGNEAVRQAWLEESGATQLSEHPIAFTVSGGEARSVLAHPDDPLHVVNFKKGFISALLIGNQISPAASSKPKSKKEHRDVQGLCPLTLISKGKELVIAKKDLYHCVLPRQPIKQASPYSAFWDLSFVKYLINSTFECESTLEEKGKLLRKLSCNERHAGKIDSSYNTQYGLQTEITYDFVLQESGASSSISPLQVASLKQTGIEYIYEDPGLDDGQNEDPAEAKQLLQHLLDESEVTLDTIPKFLALVQHMRHLGDLQELTEEAEKCPEGQKDCARKQKGVALYLDALVQCNRLPCVRALRQLHTKKLVKRSLLELALFSWLRLPVKDHRYFPEILEICRESQSRFCWLALGGLVKTYSRDHTEIPDDVRNIATTFSSILGTSCGLKEVTFPGGTTGDQKTNYITTMIKAVGNMRNYGLKLEPGLMKKMLACAENANLPDAARSFALRNIGSMRHSLPPEVVSGLTAILTDQKQPMLLRVEAYLNLLDINEATEELVNVLADILVNDPSKQLKSFMASDMVRLSEDDKTDTIKAVMKLATDRGADLTELARMDHQKYSHVSYRESVSTLPEGLLPKELSTFGHELVNDVVFNGWSAIPASIATHLNLTLFGQAIDLVEVGLQITGLDGLLVRSSSTLEGLMTADNTNAMQYASFILQQLSGRKPPVKKPKALPPALLNQKWEDNIQKIFETYQNSHHQDTVPYVLLYLRMLGIDLDFTTLQDIAGGMQRLMQQMNQGSRPQKTISSPIPFSRAHVLNFLEGEHLFPTSMGALLKWRSNFTVAVSLDAKADVDVKHQSGSVHFKPSLAATLSNQMVFSLPGVTDLGIQTQNNLYSNQQWDLEGSGGPTMKFKLLAPKTKQRPLELSRNNYLLRGSELVELDDWNAERIDSHECLGGNFVKATGMKVCITSSHLDVRHRNDKPFYYLAGRANWAISAEMEDTGVAAYTMAVAFKRKSKEEYQLDINLDGKGDLYRREVPLSVSLNKGTGEFNLDLKHSDFPDFSLTAVRNRITEGGDHLGFRSEILLKDKQLLWDLLYTKTEKKEIRLAKPRNESPRGQSVEAILENRELSLKTLYNDYSYKLKLHKHPSGNLKVDSLLVYQNLDENHNWLVRILPDIFYEKGNRKAWLEFRGDWRFGLPKPAAHKGHGGHGGHGSHAGHGGHHGGHPGTQHRDSKSHLSIPATVIEVITHHMQNPKHSMTCFNISKVERSSGDLLLFANLTYNVWRKGQGDHEGDVIRSANFTLARHSWNLESRVNGNLYAAAEAENTRIYTLTGEKMIPKDPERDGHYIGWWNPESASRFEARKWKVIYRQHLHRKPVGEDDLPSDSRNEIQDDLSSEENDGHSSEEEEVFISSKGIKNEAIHADVSLEYPFADKQENLTFKGSFQWNGRRAPSYRTFLKTFTMASTRHSLQLDSQSVWTKAGNEKVILSHHSSITNTQTQKNQGVYNLLFKKLLKDSCKNIYLNHSISAHWLNFASHVIGSCKPGNPKARQYDIHIQTDHAYWKELNYNVNQLVDLSKPGGETMNLTSPTMDVRVKGAWNDQEYSKQADFTSKTDLMPTTRWEFSWDRKKLMLLQILAPDEELSKITLKRELKDGNKKVEYTVSHINKSSGDEVHDDFHMIARIVDRHTVQLTGGLKPELGGHLAKWVANFVKRASERLMSKLRDPNHELNKNLQGVLKGKTVMEYLDDLQKRGCQRAETWVKDLAEIVKTFESFYGPSFRIVANTISEIERSNSELAEKLSNTHLGWAWEYFDLKDHLGYLSTRLPKWKGKSSKEIAFDWTFKHPFTFTHFNELPKLDAKGSNWGDLHSALGPDSHYAIPDRGNHDKMAIIFGPTHVLTFDGRVLSFPNYPNEKCAVLLAHDVRGKTFSVLGSRSSIFLIFPEMAVTIHESGRVYINSSIDETPTPITSYKKNIRVSRMGSILRVESPFLDVDCDTDNEICILVLAPLMTGGVIGLLGNADGEQFNELSGPESNLVESTSEFAALYEISGEPGCKNFVDPGQASSEDPKAGKICDGMLAKDEVVECLTAAGICPKDLRGACLSDMKRENCPCATSKAITALCAYDGYQLDRCQWKRRPEGSTPVPNQHDSWLIKGTHQLQLVFVVEANKGVLGGGSTQALKGLESFLENIEESFTSNGGYTSITYALVVYGSARRSTDHPNIYMHTQHRSPWMLQRDLLKSVKEVSFDSSARGDPVSAVEFATTVIPFDPAATKIITIIALDDKPEASRVGYSHVHDVQKNLDHHGAAIYVLSSYPWLEHGKKVYGLRADGLIFPSAGGESYGNFPRMPCAKMAAGTRGSIFWRSFLEDNKNPLFFESLAGEMLARVQKEAGKCRQCVCAMNPWWQRHTYCKPAPAHLQNC